VEVAPVPSYADPRVSRRKFDRELVAFNALRSDYVKRGIWLLEANFPNMLVAFVKPLKPVPPVVFSALIDFTDYDLRPPSVVLVDPFTKRELLHPEILTHFQRLIPATVPGQLPTGQILLTSHSDQRPFICLPGLRQYHEHPAHTGDSWLLHRGSAEGTLHFIVDNLQRYGVEGIVQYGFGLQIQMTHFQANAIE
jgi:hypothetical protein